MPEAEKRGPGRPQELPGDARPRTIRMTDDERVAVVTLLQFLRSQKPQPAPKPRKRRKP
jgi:hypothetical protein